jgi:hypothetical protein
MKPLSEIVRGVSGALSEDGSRKTEVDKQKLKAQNETLRPFDEAHGKQAQGIGDSGQAKKVVHYSSFVTKL